MTVNDYLNLITSKWRTRPKFVAMISNDLAVPVQVQSLLTSMIPLFDIDVAVGDQLDIIGKWVGITRNVSIPIPGVFFSWDDVQADGWDYGSWQPANEPAEITVLPDDAYLTLLRAKIAANQWDGTTNGAYAIWEALFPTFTILIQDNQDMSYYLAIVGGIIDSLTLALILGGYIPLKPEGVQIAGYFISTGDEPSFAWDVPSSDLLAGWDEGYWLAEYPAT